MWTMSLYQKKNLIGSYMISQIMKKKTDFHATSGGDDSKES